MNIIDLTAERLKQKKIVFESCLTENGLIANEIGMKPEDFKHIEIISKRYRNSHHEKSIFFCYDEYRSEGILYVGTYTEY